MAAMLVPSRDPAALLAFFLPLTRRTCAELGREIARTVGGASRN
jgi:hypothetical protein